MVKPQAGTGSRHAAQAIPSIKICLHVELLIPFSNPGCKVRDYRSRPNAQTCLYVPNVPLCRCNAAKSTTSLSVHLDHQHADLAAIIDLRGNAFQGGKKQDYSSSRGGLASTGSRSSLAAAADDPDSDTDAPPVPSSKNSTCCCLACCSCPASSWNASAPLSPSLSLSRSLAL